jgi:hypothetical protein
LKERRIEGHCDLKKEEPKGSERWMDALLLDGCIGWTQLLGHQKFWTHHICSNSASRRSKGCSHGRESNKESQITKLHFVTVPTQKGKMM